MGERILAIDPGNEQSAYVVLEDGTPDLERSAKVANGELRARIKLGAFDDCELAAVEWIESYGMAVGATVFHTCRWVGQFECEWRTRGRLEARLVPRREVKLYVCQSPRANDKNIRAALIEHYGPGKRAAIGLKASPGPLYGFRADMWAALGVAFTVQQVRERFPRKETA